MTSDTTAPARLRPFQHGYEWDDVPRQPYKEDDAAPFRSISRQVLFAEAALGCELRYFEMAEGGYSTLERHEHMHAVMILRGHGQCLLGEEVRDVKPFDLVTIPGWCWHQFRANRGEPLGFLCMVNATRDRPQLPDAHQLAVLAAKPGVRAFLRSGVREPSDAGGER